LLGFIEHLSRCDV